MNHYYIETYGCQMNLVDSELVAGILESEGYRKVDDIARADAIFLNTCSVREHAEDKIHSRLGVLKKLKRETPNLLIGVLGCMAQNLKEDILINKPYVDFVLGPDSYRRIPELITKRQQLQQSIVDTRLSRYEIYEGLFPSRHGGVNAWIPIMRGCDKFCTFCIVPFTRGRERSRPMSSIVSEIQKAVEEGFVEITLLGQNVNSYYHEENYFPQLLDAVASISGVRRIRFTSPHPQDVGDDMLHMMLKHDNICKSIHLPLQAGSDNVLLRMNRTYSKNQFLSLVEKIRTILPGCGLTTDIIVGFPGETDRDFDETLNVMKKVKFDSAFTFKYSKRPGTKSAGYDDTVSNQEKQKRLEKVIALQKKHTILSNKREIGKTLKVLVEKESKKSDHFWSGRTNSNKWVIFPKGNSKIKEFVDVVITDAKGVSLFGEIVETGE